MGTTRFMEFECLCTERGVEFETVLYCLYSLLFGENCVKHIYTDEVVKMLTEKGVFKNSFEYDAFIMECNDDDSDYKIFDRVANRTHDIFVTKEEWKMIQDSATGWVSPYAGPEHADCKIQQCPKCKTEIKVFDFYA